MTDRPILFSAPMIRALLAGTKTQTRRLFKGIEPLENGTFHIAGNGGGIVGVCEEDVSQHAPDYVRIQVGDRLWVRETWSGHHMFRETPPSQRVSFNTPDGPYLREDVWLWADGEPTGGDYEKPLPGIHMPRWASRLTLTVTDVRVERLQDISGADAIAEGADITGEQTMTGPMVKVAPGTYLSPVAWYHRLWDDINGKGAWDANPWVVAYTFNVQHSNIDQLAKVAA
jgi:hypothetical protein